MFTKLTKSKKKYLQIFEVLITVFSNIRLLSHVNLCYGDRKGENSCNKLPKYRRHVSNDMKQSDLNGANSFICLHHVTKSSERKEHGIEAVQISRYYNGSVVDH